MFAKEAQEKLKAEYRERLADVWQGKMLDYCTKEADVVIKFRDDYYVEIKKSRIETSFCFGYGFCGVSDEDDYRRAENMADHAKKSQEYFLAENLKDLDRTIKAISDYDLYFQNRYYNQKNNSIKHIVYKKPWDVVEPGLEKLTDQEKNLLAEGYKVERERFTKRLNTYLKRFGLSKVRSWSYLSD